MDHNGRRGAVGRHAEPSAGSGKLHGTWIKILAVVSVVAAAVAVWQFSWFPLGDDSVPSGQDAAMSSLELSAAPDTTDAEPSSPQGADSPSAGPESSTEDESVESATDDEPVEPTAESAEPEPPAPEDGCTASLRLDDSWEGNIQVGVVVANSGDSAIEAWEVRLDLDGVEIYHYWNMEHHSGAAYRNEHWNGRLDSGAETAAAFQAEVAGDYDLPDSVPCEPV